MNSDGLLANRIIVAGESDGRKMAEIAARARV